MKAAAYARVSTADQVDGFSLSAQLRAIRAHCASQGWTLASTRTSRRRLNPDFAEWLMGWPLGWTEAGSPLPETEWSRWWRHMRGSLYELGWR